MRDFTRYRVNQTPSVGYSFEPSFIKKGHFTAFAVLGSSSIAFDIKTSIFSVEPRLIPAVIGLYGFPRDNIRHLTAIYKQLQDSGLPFLSREVTLVSSPRDPTGSVEALLPPSAQQLPSADIKALFDTICTQHNCIYNADSKNGITQIMLPQPVFEKPDVLILDLKDEPLGDALTRQGFSGQVIAAMRDDLLAENTIPNSYEDFVTRPLAYFNRAGIKEFDHELGTDRYLLPTRLTKNIRAGSLLKLKGDQFVPVGQEQCASEKVTNIPTNFSLQITRPDIIATAIDSDAWIMGIAKAPSAFVNLSSVSWHEAVQPTDNNNCSHLGPDLFLVRTTLTVHDLSIVVHGPEALVRQIQAQQSNNVWTQPDPNRLELKQSGDRVLAFQVTPLTAKTATNVSEAQTNAQFYALLKGSNVPVRIPIKAWFTYVYLTPKYLAAAFSNDSTALSSSDVRVFPLEADTPTPQSYSVSANAADDAAGLVESHKLIRTAINIFDSTSILQSTPRRPIIGLAESGSSLDVNHPLLTGVNWYPKISSHPCDPDSMAQLKQCDHATFVTGLLGGKEAIDPALAAKLRLHFIELEASSLDLASDIANATRICDMVSLPADAAAQPVCGVHIINFSQTYENEQAASIASALKAFEAKDKTKEVIFIAAADDKMQGQLPPDYSKPLLSFMKNSRLTRLIIGVSEGSIDSIPPTAPHSKDFINLIAPGKTTGPIIKGTVGTKEGTSVAVPQVAIAAVLIASQQGTVKNVNARLIYTADPLAHGYDDDVWGGYLNVFRAASYLNDGLLVLPTTPSIQYRVQPGGGHIMFSGYLISPFQDDNIPIPDKSINMSNVLRIVHLLDNRWRIIYLDDGELKIATANKISGDIGFTYIGSVIEEIKGGEKKFKAQELPAAVLNQSQAISVQSIQDYTAPINKVEGWH
jgi:subtilase family protein